MAIDFNRTTSITLPGEVSAFIQLSNMYCNPTKKWI